MRVCVANWGVCPTWRRAPPVLPPQAIYECLGRYTKDEARVKAFKERRIDEIVEAGVGAAAAPKPRS